MFSGGLLSSRNFATVATGRDDFSSLYPGEIGNGRYANMGRGQAKCFNTKVANTTVSTGPRHSLISVA